MVVIQIKNMKMDNILALKLEFNIHINPLSTNN